MKTAVLDIGGTDIKSGIFENGRLSRLAVNATDAGRGGEAVMLKAEEILKGYLNQGFTRIGISTAGQVDSVRGIIQYANSNLPGYTGMRIKDRLEEVFQVPAAVENDVNAAALGEAVYGAGREFSHFLCLTYGTGVGGAIVIDQKIYTGSSFSAGEFGAIVTHGRDRDPGKDMFSGCYERYASVSALIRQVQTIDAGLDSGVAIFNRLSEPEIRQAVDQWIEEILYGLTTLIHIFNPPCIILGGGVMKQSYVGERIQKLAPSHVMESFCSVSIRCARLGNQAGLYGAGISAERQSG